jgi:hypothetical protein
MNKISMTKKYTTRDDRPVRIMSIDIKNAKYPVIAVILNSDGSETVEIFTAAGNFYNDTECEVDLIEIVPFNTDDRVMVKCLDGAKVRADTSLICLAIDSNASMLVATLGQQKVQQHLGLNAAPMTQRLTGNNMKSKIQYKTGALTFPRLMQSKRSKAVFLITSIDGIYAFGMLVSGVTRTGRTIGSTSDVGWNAEDLIDFDDIVTLEN